MDYQVCMGIHACLYAPSAAPMESKTSEVTPWLKSPNPAFPILVEKAVVTWKSSHGNPWKKAKKPQRKFIRCKASSVFPRKHRVLTAGLPQSRRHLQTSPRDLCRVWEERNRKTDEIYNFFLSAFSELEGGHFNLKGFTCKFNSFNLIEGKLWPEQRLFAWCLLLLLPSPLADNPFSPNAPDVEHQDISARGHQHLDTHNSIRRNYGEHYNLLVSNTEKIKISRTAQFMLAAGWPKDLDIKGCGGVVAPPGPPTHLLNTSGGMAEKMASVFLRPQRLSVEKVNSFGAYFKPCTFCTCCWPKED